MTTLDHLNTCPPEEFVALVGPAFEHSPWIAGAVVRQRPFTSRDQLHAALSGVVMTSDEAHQIALIRAYPDLAGREALSVESFREHAAAGLTDLGGEEIEQFDRYNTAYKARFGFPFVICARKHQKDAMLRALHERLSHSREEEIAVALEQIVQIAALRLADLVDCMSEM